jgi:MoaA/NifB/PqqE/SkfB family radical SAM enzyme
MIPFYNSIKTIQIEHSSMCNAACPQCLREWWGGDYSRIKQTYIPTEFYDKKIPQHIYDNLVKIDFCGDVGDPCTGPNFIDVCRVVKQKNPNIVLSIATNGGMKSPEWWAELASVLSSNDHVIFGIDGLEDTNWIYRVNVRWSKLMENVKSFIGAGGQAMWQFVSFEHNEHQIEQARELSEQMGFHSFFTIYNNRFAVEDLLQKGPTFGANGKQLKPPKAEQEISIIIRKNKLVKEFDKWAQEAEKGCIKCQAQQYDEAYIDAEGHLLPCCYIAGAKFTLEPKDPDGYYDLWTNYGGDKINLNLHSWKEILDSDFYQQLIQRWTKTFAEGRLHVCSGTCSYETSQFTEYKNKKK